MAKMLLSVLMLVAMVGASDGAWCVCKPDASNSQQQKTLDYACGAGADCAPIHQNGACYNPDTVVNHCSYAANSFYQRNNQDQQACNFDGSAQLVSTDPSTAGCTYPATPSAAGTSGTPSSSSSPGSAGNGFSPNSSTGTGATTTTGGTGTGTGLAGLGPTGTGLDASDAADSLLSVTSLLIIPAASLICFLGAMF